MPREAPVMRAVPFDGELLMFFSPDLSCIYLLFIWITTSMVEDCLSEAHRNYPGMGCPVSALAGDLARSDKHTRAVATRKTRDNIELLASLIRETNKSDKDTARSRAVMAYCAMVGAISMARAVSDKELSREILKTVAQRLKNPAL